uniref:Uncharacterized protein n=1 Tax=Aegilops tauschii subsp. strangulata TaxID=200361 RepID=A0A453HLC6_AEGTS
TQGFITNYIWQHHIFEVFRESFFENHSFKYFDAFGIWCQEKLKFYKP